MKGKRIRLRYDPNEMTVEIIEQTHRESEFGFKSGSNSFVASNGFVLASVAVPEVRSDMLYVRGSNNDKDSVVMCVRSEELMSKLRIAVSEYNNYTEPKMPIEIIE